MLGLVDIFVPLFLALSSLALAKGMIDPEVRSLLNVADTEF